MAVLFDTLRMVETLQAGGFTDQQARAVTTALADAASVAEVATRSDLMDLGVGLKHDFAALETKVTHDIAALETKLTHDIAALETKVTHEIAALDTKLTHEISGLKTEISALELRITIRLGGIVVASSGLLFTALHFFH